MTPHIVILGGGTGGTLAANRLRVVPGALSKGMNTAGNYLPRWLVAPIIGRFYEGISQ